MFLYGSLHACIPSTNESVMQRLAESGFQKAKEEVFYVVFFLLLLPSRCVVLCMCVLLYILVQCNWFWL